MNLKLNESQEIISFVIQNAREHLIPFSIATNKDYIPNWHHAIIGKELEHIEHYGDKDYKILLLSLPPRHGKSELASIQFPAWFLGRNPNKEIIISSYSADLAYDFGGKTREKVNSLQYKTIFPEVQLKEDEKSKGNWKTKQGGGYIAAGVGGPITGRGADILLIDDPIKNREEAESEVIRNKIWDWFTSTAFTRLEPKGVVIVIMCMTGETPVLMADGTECALRDIHVGDKIATYDNGVLSTSIVKNWANSGRDFILKITTSSGKIVRANKKHPFLISENGKLKWKQAKDLLTTQKIVTLKDNGVNGRAKLVSGKIVNYQLSAVGTALHTTQKRNGQMAAVLRLLIQNRFVDGVLKIATELLSKSMMFFSKNRMVNALFANNLQPIMSAPIGGKNFVSTIATKQIKSERYSVMTAISLLGIQKLKKLRSQWQTTSDFTLEEIVSIQEDGFEEVFDIEVEKTGNFIANGVVSHNTRWHLDDLAGRILEHPELSKRTKVIRFSAIAERDEIKRSAGSALWPERYPIGALAEIRTTVGPYDWAALYQGHPVLTENQEFKPIWLKYLPEVQVSMMNCRRFLTIDTAMSKKTQADFTGFCDNRVNDQNFWHIKAWQAKISPEELVNALFALQIQNQYQTIGIERTSYLEGLKPYLDMEQRRRNMFLPIVDLQHNQVNKEVRIRGLIPRYASGSIFHITGETKELEQQMTNFPVGVHDDILDALAYQLQVADGARSGSMSISIKDYSI